jgi:hypothetical protein
MNQMKQSSWLKKVINMIYTFRKIEDNYYSAFNTPLAGGRYLKFTNNNLEKLIFKTFKSAKLHPNISMCYNFDDPADEAYFLLWSSNGIKI